MQRSLAAVILLIAALAVAGGGWVASVVGEPTASGNDGSTPRTGGRAPLAVAVSGTVSARAGDDARILGQGELPPVTRVDYAAFPTVNVPSPSTARTWYVASTGDDQATGAPDRALRTIEAALRRAGNGDIVYVRGGAYAATGLVVTQSDFLLSAYPGESVTIEPAEASSTYGLTIAAPGQHDVTVRGLRLDGFADVGIYAGNPRTVYRLALEDVTVVGSDRGFAGTFQPGAVAVDGLVVRRMTLSEIHDVGFQFGRAGGRNVRITGLHVQMVPPAAATATAPLSTGTTGTGGPPTTAAAPDAPLSPTTSGVAAAPGAVLAAGSGGDGLAFAAGDNVLIENTIVEGAAGDGIDLEATRAAVVNAVVRRVGRGGIRLGAGGDAVNCLVFGTGADAQLVTEGGSYRIIDCTFAGAPAQGEDVAQDGDVAQGGSSYAATFGYPGSVGDVALINSAFYEQPGPLFFSAGMNVRVQQCDFWGFPDRLVEWGERSWDTAAMAGSVGAQLGSGNKVVDPRFVDPERGDFHPGPASPLFGAGTPAPPAPTFDLILEARDPARHAIGAYQTTLPSRLSFADVPFDHPYREAIVALAGSRVVSGYQGADGSILFKPDDAVRRAQFAKMVSGVFRLPVNESLVAPFTDLGIDDPQNLYPHDYVAAAALAGVTRGVDPGVFAPYADITRAQVVTMLVRGTERLAPSALADPPAVYLGTMGDFSADHGSTMRSAEYNGLLAGIVGFGRDWNPWQAATRGEVAQMLHVLAGKL